MSFTHDDRISFGTCNYVSRSRYVLASIETQRIVRENLLHEYELIRACTDTGEGGITKSRHAPLLLFAYLAIRMKNGNRRAPSRSVLSVSRLSMLTITRLLGFSPRSRVLSFSILLFRSAYSSLHSTFASSIMRKWNLLRAVGAPIVAEY